MSNQKTKHARLQAMRNNNEYCFIGDRISKTFHRKDSRCVEAHITKNAMVGLGRDPKAKGFRPCPLCHPEQVELPPAKKCEGLRKTRSSLTREGLLRIAEEYGLHLEIIGPNVYVTTIAGEWFFDYNIRPIVLHHKNNRTYLNKSGKPKSHYHEQEYRFPTPLETIKYIYRHERAAVQRSFQQDVENGDGPILVTLKEAVSVAEKQAIIAALTATGGCKKEAAEILGISVRSLYHKRKVYNLE